MKKFSNKTLLIISNGYPSQDGGIPSHIFVKSQVDELKKHFKKIIVISPKPYFPKWLAKTNLFPTLYQDFAQFENYSYDNVEVYFPRFFTLPIKFFRDRNGEAATKTTLKLIKNERLKFDIIHAHFTWFSGYVAKKISKEYNKEYFLTVHENSDWFKLELNSGKEEIYDTWKSAKGLIRVNEQDVPKLKKYNKNTVSIPNGFNEKLFYKRDKSECRKQLGLDQNKKIILHVGFYKQWHKNQLTIIRAAKEFLKKRKDFEVYLIGGGPDEALFKAEVKKLGLEKHVKIIGKKPHKEIPIWMNAADLFVFPSFSESFGVVAIEALACGTPVITTVNGGTEEIINSENYGFVFEEFEDKTKIAELMEKSLIKNWDGNQIVDYSQNYRWEKVKSRLISMYGEDDV